MLPWHPSGVAAGQYSGRRRRRYFVVGKPLLCCIVLVERCVEVWGLLFSVMFDAKFWMKKSVLHFSSFETRIGRMNSKVIICDFD
mmetsp:Transcript_34615/g.62337  ORF Transcript_34615/g.62337 Transcript_34615/m.62337 type:complete len:85 (+) Transcript_34615:1023-1277(+)